jgi:hypothetical protein
MSSASFSANFINRMSRCINTEQITLQNLLSYFEYFINNTIQESYDYSRCLKTYNFIIPTQYKGNSEILPLFQNKLEEIGFVIEDYNETLDNGEYCLYINAGESSKIGVTNISLADGILIVIKDITSL